MSVKHFDSIDSVREFVNQFAKRSETVVNPRYAKFLVRSGAEDTDETRKFYALASSRNATHVVESGRKMNVNDVSALIYTILDSIADDTPTSLNDLYGYACRANYGYKRGDDTTFFPSLCWYSDEDNLRFLFRELAKAGYVDEMEIRTRGYVCIRLYYV